MLRSFLLALVLAGCSHGGNVPLPNIPWCSASSAVRWCGAGYLRDGEACASCDNADYTMSCQVDTGSSYLYAVCVDDCESCAPGSPLGKGGAATTDYSAVGGIHLCEPLSYRASAWCATCDSNDISLSTDACDTDGFCNPVVCVADCSTCPPDPQPPTLR